MADSQGPLEGIPEDRRQQWYDESSPELSTETRDVLENYSKIPPNEIESHLRNIVRTCAHDITRHTANTDSIARQGLGDPQLSMYWSMAISRPIHWDTLPVS